MDIRMAVESRDVNRIQGRMVLCRGLYFEDVKKKISLISEQEKLFNRNLIIWIPSSECVIPYNQGIKKQRR